MTLLIDCLWLQDYLTQLTTEFFLLTDRNIQYTVTNLLMFLRGITRGLYHEDVVIPETTPKAVFYNISLDGLDIPLQAYTAHLTILQCTEDSKIGNYRPATWRPDMKLDQHLFCLR